jgi:hypothetical protein
MDGAWSRVGMRNVWKDGRRSPSPAGHQLQCNAAMPASDCCRSSAIQYYVQSSINHLPLDTGRWRCVFQ